MSTPGARRALLPVTLTAVGVVYGDIGTSPLYAMRECFFSTHSVPPTHDNVLGVLSLIIYSLLLVISIKYMVLVLRADNNGEGRHSRADLPPPGPRRRRAARPGPARHLRRRAALRGRDDYAGDYRPRRHRGHDGRHAGVRAVCRAGGRRHPVRGLRHSAVRDPQDRAAVRPGDGRLVRDDRGARRHLDRPPARGARRGEPDLCRQLLPRQWTGMDSPCSARSSSS